MIVDVFAADLQAFEEGLVEEAAFGRVGLAVGIPFPEDERPLLEAQGHSECAESQFCTEP